MLADVQKIIYTVVFFLPHRGVHVKHDEPVDVFHTMHTCSMSGYCLLTEWLGESSDPASARSVRDCGPGEAIFRNIYRRVYGFTFSWVIFPLT